MLPWGPCIKDPGTQDLCSSPQGGQRATASLQPAAILGRRLQGDRRLRTQRDAQKYLYA